MDTDNIGFGVLPCLSVWVCAGVGFLFHSDSPLQRPSSPQSVTALSRRRTQVEEEASEFDNIECCWSRAGNLADKIFASAGGVSVGDSSR